MKYHILLFATFLSSLVYGQQYDGLFIENRKVDQNNQIYTPGKEFVYQFQIQKDDPIYLVENAMDEFKLTEFPDSAGVTEVHLTVIKPRLFQRTNTNQTEIYYSYEPNPSSTFSTGIVENDQNTWIHPPRSGFFRSLETCPFPYLKHHVAVGDQWTDSMSIGEHWSHPMWGEWDGRLLLTYTYELAGKESLETNFGDLDCLVIEATAQSKADISRLKAYYHPEFGFVKLVYTLFTGILVELHLHSVMDGPVLRDGRSFFENKYK